GGLGGLNFQGCRTSTDPLEFTAEAGTTYYFQVGSFNPGVVQFNLDAIPAPPNDDFDNATAVPQLPFEDTVNNVAATVEAGEPTGECGQGSLLKTVWYQFTPTSSGSITANFGLAGALYTGSSLTDLSQVDPCVVLGR